MKDESVRPGDLPMSKQWALHRLCSAFPAGHRHCKHGHTEDCPDPGNCDLLPEAE